MNVFLMHFIVIALIINSQLGNSQRSEIDDRSLAIQRPRSYLETVGIRMDQPNNRRKLAEWNSYPCQDYPGFVDDYWGATCSKLQKYNNCNAKSLNGVPASEACCFCREIRVPAPRTPPSHDCFIEKDMDYYGNDITRKTLESQSECSSWCASHSTCSYWTYNIFKERCYLKNSKAGRSARNSEAGLVSGNKACGSCMIEKDTDYYGNDIVSRNKASQGECTSWCASHSTCSYWTYHASNGRCYLKNSKAGREKLKGVVSGNKECAKPPRQGCLVERDWDYYGNDIVNDYKKYRINCQLWCAKHSSCSYWTFHPKSGRCYLKYSKAGGRFHEGIVSGVSPTLSGELCPKP